MFNRQQLEVKVKAMDLRQVIAKKLDNYLSIFFKIFLNEYTYFVF